MEFICFHFVIVVTVVDLFLLLFLASCGRVSEIAWEMSETRSNLSAGLLKHSEDLCGWKVQFFLDVFQSLSLQSDGHQDSLLNAC